jgi:2-dehydropantoate 2-reductase
MLSQNNINEMEHPHTDFWHILGVGAIGGLFAFFLKERSCLILNPNSALNAKGLRASKANKANKRVTLTLEKKRTLTEFTLPYINHAESSQIKNLLICTKANDTARAIENLKLIDNTNIVLLQNGMGNAELLAKTFPNCHIFCATTTHGAYRINKNHIVHAGEGQTWLGSLDKVSDTKNINSLCLSLSTEQSLVNADMEMEKRLWIKLAINCAINPLTVIYQCKNGELLKTSERVNKLKTVCNELDKILKAKKFLAQDQSCLEIVKTVAKDTANNFSSMYQDFKNQQASEIDFIQGYLLKEAQHLDIPMPENQKLLTTIQKIEASY